MRRSLSSRSARRALARLALAFAVGLCAVAAPCRARAAPDPELKRAQDRFQYGAYADAVKRVTRLLDQGRLSSDEELIEAHRILGLSYYYLEKKEEARSALVRLLSVDPDYRLDPFFYPPKLVEFFDLVKRENETLLAPIREQKTRIEAERFRAEQARIRLLEEERRRRLLAEEASRRRGQELVETTIVRHPYLLNWVPFGGGQFQNGEITKGSFLAAAQVFAGGASLIGYLVTANLRRCLPLTLPGGSLGQPDQLGLRCGIPAENRNLAETMTSLKWTAGGLFWSLVVYGIVDAHLGWKPAVIESTRRRSRPAPDAAEQETAKSTRNDPAPAAASKPPSLHLAFTPFFGPGQAGAALLLTF